MKIKFCGIRRDEDAHLMNEFLPDYTGFVFAKSKRQVNLDAAKRLSEILDRRIKTVGVFVNEEIGAVAKIASEAGLFVVQLHGDEDRGYISALKSLLPKVEIWKAVRVSSAEDIRIAEGLGADMILLDSFSKEAYGGTGKVANLDAIKESGITGRKKFFLAGGLCAGNLEGIVREIKPFGVDISSGIEENGFKSRDKIIQIMSIMGCFNCQKEDTGISEDSTFPKP